MLRRFKLRLLFFYYVYVIQHQTECDGKWYRFKFVLGIDTFAIGRNKDFYQCILEFRDKEYYWEKVFTNLYRLQV